MCVTPCRRVICICGPVRTTSGILSGPPSVKSNCASPVNGGGTAAPNENGRAFHAEFAKTPLTSPVYPAPGRGRLLPKARGCANGLAAPFTTLPLMTSASHTTSAGSAAWGEEDGGGAPVPMISAYVRMASVMVSGAPVNGTAISRVTSANPRICTRSVHAPSSRSGRRKTPSPSELVVMTCAPCDAVTTAPGTGSPEKRMRPVRTAAASADAVTIHPASVRRGPFEVIDHQVLVWPFAGFHFQPQLLLHRRDDGRKLGVCRTRVDRIHELEMKMEVAGEAGLVQERPVKSR